MNLVKVWSLAASVAAAATVFGLACTTNSDGDHARTGAARTSLNPHGNNGTVKIQEQGATDEIPDNDPHVGCKFLIEFRGFDKGDLNATWTLSAQPPSGAFTAIGNGEVFIGEDAAGGATDLDGTVTVDLADYPMSGLFEHPQQGYHIKLEVHAEGSIGADTKFKVFWVEGCGGSSTSSSGTTTSSSSSGQPTW